MKRTLLSIASALTLAVSSTGAVAATGQTAGPDHEVGGFAQESHDNLRPADSDPAGSMTLHRSDCDVGWYWIEKGERFACYLGPYDDDYIAIGVQHGWEAGGANVTGGRLERDCAPFWDYGSWCAAIYATV